ncbi:hypothetical protein [uncultured Hymenobacter sp.]|uniref:hypothetical protein n=1 Tax=uncultured Hymenobacter sp. TaxID=170016 RepID=UPI0035C9D1FA
MESLFLCSTPDGRRVYLYAVPDGVPLYFKHNELVQEPGYRPLWRGNPAFISEAEAASLVAQLETPHAAYRNYHGAAGAMPGFPTAKESFQSAVERLGQQLEYAPGAYPAEVLVGEMPAP